jgi:hypothetical protein
MADQVGNHHQAPDLAPGLLRTCLLPARPQVIARCRTSVQAARFERLLGPP